MSAELACTYIHFELKYKKGDLYHFLSALIDWPYSRGAAYGLANTSARIGGMIAPQIVFLVIFFIELL